MASYFNTYRKRNGHANPKSQSDWWGEQSSLWLAGCVDKATWETPQGKDKTFVWRTKGYTASRWCSLGSAVVISPWYDKWVIMCWFRSWTDMHVALQMLLLPTSWKTCLCGDFVMLQPRGCECMYTYIAMLYYVWQLVAAIGAAATVPLDGATACSLITCSSCNPKSLLGCSFAPWQVVREPAFPSSSFLIFPLSLVKVV